MIDDIENDKIPLDNIQFVKVDTCNENTGTLLYTLIYSIFNINKRVQKRTFRND